MSEISEREYHAEVMSIAEDMAKEARSGEHGTGDDCREWLNEYVWETIDGHEWVIYTYKSQQILAISQNDGYSAENFGIESVVTDGAINWAALAFGALYADVMEALWRVEIDGETFDPNDPNPEPEESDE